MDGNGDTEADNVIRLPRDWVGPPEELVPIGSRARPREGPAEDRAADEPAGDGADGDVILDAGDFWGESAAAVHHVMRAPVEAPTAEFRPPRRRRARLPRVRAWPRVHVASRGRVHMGSRGRTLARTRGRTAAIATVLGAIAVIAVIGVSEGHGGRPAASAATVAQARAQESASTSQAATNRRHHRGFTRTARPRPRAPRRAFSERQSVRYVRVKRHPARGAAPRTRHATTRPRSVITHAVTTSVPTTPAPSSPVVSTTVSTAAPPSATQAGEATGTSTTTTEQPPAASSGPLGPGAATGCDPKCS